MNTRAALAACALLAFAALARAAGEPALTPFTATYEVRYGSKRVGESTFALHADQGQSKYWVFESRTVPKGLAKMLTGGIVETSEFVLEGGNVRPLRFNAAEAHGKGSQSVIFDWPGKVAHSERNGERAELELQPRVLDHSLVQVALMLDLASGRQLASYLLVDKNELRSYDYTRVGEETVETPAGSYRAVQVKQTRAGSTREIWFWCAPELGYLPARVDQRKDGKVLLTMNLTSAQVGAPE